MQKGPATWKSITLFLNLASKVTREQVGNLGTKLPQIKLKTRSDSAFFLKETLDRTEHWIYFGELIFSVCSSILVYLKQYLQRKISNTARYNRNFFWWRKSIRGPYRVIFITRDCCQYYCTAVRCFPVIFLSLRYDGNNSTQGIG